MSEYIFVTNIFEYSNIRIYSSHSGPNSHSHNNTAAPTTIIMTERSNVPRRPNWNSPKQGKRTEFTAYPVLDQLHLHRVRIGVYSTVFNIKWGPHIIWVSILRVKESAKTVPGFMAYNNCVAGLRVQTGQSRLRSRLLSWSWLPHLNRFNIIVIICIHIVIVIIIIIIIIIIVVFSHASLNVSTGPVVASGRNFCPRWRRRRGFFLLDREVSHLKSIFFAITILQYHILLPKIEVSDKLSHPKSVFFVVTILIIIILDEASAENFKIITIFIIINKWNLPIPAMPI